MNKQTINAAILDILDNVRAAFFDFDGVIADTEPLHALTYVQLMKDQGITFDSKQFSHYLGHPAAEILEMLERDYGVVFDKQQANKQRNKYFLEMVSQYKLQPNYEIVDILQYFHKQNKLAAILSSQRESVIKRLLEQWDLYKYLSKIYSTFESTLTKQEAFDRASELLGAETRDVVVIEDSFHILTEAQSRGMRTIGIIHSLNNTLDIKADALIQIS